MLAADYDWMFDDDALANGRAINLPATARLLQRISRTNLVLDAACGTGVDAAVLARRGFTVWAADGSEAMVEGAAARFRREQLAIPLVCSTWAGLPAATSERFDVVLCLGNSLVHAAGRDAMVQALTGLRQMARPGGYVVVDRLGDEHIAHLVFVFENGSQIEAHEHQITFRPFTISELRARLHLAGLTEVDTDFDGSLGRYAVVTVAA
jgi:2-polyprenyl-3-methyl-5-hydroxy-6-metoxy-1,4-benzoquinol methylase